MNSYKCEDTQKIVICFTSGIDDYEIYILNSGAEISSSKEIEIFDTKEQVLEKYPILEDKINDKLLELNPPKITQ